MFPTYPFSLYFVDSFQSVDFAALLVNYLVHLAYGPFPQLGSNFEVGGSFVDTLLRHRLFYRSCHRYGRLGRNFI